MRPAQSRGHCGRRPDQIHESPGCRKLAEISEADGSEGREVEKARRAFGAVENDAAGNAQTFGQFRFPRADGHGPGDMPADKPGDTVETGRTFLHHFSGNKHFWDIRSERRETECGVTVEQEQISLSRPCPEFGDARTHDLAARVLFPFRDGDPLVADRKPAPLKQSDGYSQCGIFFRHGAIRAGREQTDNGKLMPRGKVTDKNAETAGGTAPVDAVRGNEDAHFQSLNLKLPFWGTVSGGFSDFQKNN